MRLLSLDDTHQALQCELLAVYASVAPASLDFLGRAIVRFLPGLPKASRVAQAIGSGGRHRLWRQLRETGAPSFLTLRNGLWVAFCVLRSERCGLSLERQAWIDRADPSSYYRRVRAVTGSPWRWVRRESIQDIARRALEAGARRTRMTIAV